MEHSTRQQRTAAIGLVVIMVAGLFALFGTYWDNAWHTDVGRDEFFSPPHLVLYAGVAVMGGVVSLWALLAWLETRSLRAVFARPALRLGMIGVVATLLAAPLDEFWHHAFGRDSVIWSPPHMIGFAALFALATGFLLKAARVPGRLGAALTVVMAALLLGAVHVTVMEYESDVPQFAALWYLPVLTLGTTLAFVIIENQRRVAWMATAAAAVYIAVRAGIIGLLAALDHSLLFIPPIVLPAVVFDLGARRGWSPAMRGLAYAASIVMVYTPFLNLMEGGIRLGAGDVIVGGLLAAAAAGLVLAAFHSPLPRPAPRHAVALLAALPLVPSEARAHDPGQGAVVGEARLLAVQEGGLVTLAVHVTPEPGRGCAEYEPRGLVARRAGAALHGALTRAAACRYRGQIELPDRGRWFVYVELELDGEVAETWMPVVAPSQGGQSVRTADIYIPPAVSASYSLVQILSGVALYGVVFWFLALAVGAARQRESARAERHRRRGAPGARPAGGRAVKPRHGGTAFRRALLLATVAAAFAMPQPGAVLRAQEAPPPESGDESPPSAAEIDAARKRRHLLIPVPVVFHTSDTGWAGGIEVTHSYRSNPAAHARPAMSHLSFVYTQHDQIMAHAGTALYTAGSRYRLSGHGGYVYYPHSFYGIGRDLPHDAGEAYTSRTVSVSAAVRRLFGTGHYLGGGWSAARYALVERTPDGMLADGTIRGADGGMVAGVSLSAGVDTRDGIHSPRGGSHLSLTVRAYGPLVGGDYRFTQLTADTRRYIPMPAGQVLALHALATTTRGDVPFQMLPGMGGPSLMRGYSPSLNRDRDLVAAQLEQRVPVWRRFGAVGFAGIGASAPELLELKPDAFRISYGAGVRFAVDPRERLNLRADYGFGRHGPVLYLGIGEAF